MLLPLLGGPSLGLSCGASVFRRRSHVGSVSSLEAFRSPLSAPARRGREGRSRLLLALQRNPIEVWWEGDFERPVSIGRTIFGLRAAAHDPRRFDASFSTMPPTTAKTISSFASCGPGLATGC